MEFCNTKEVKVDNACLNNKLLGHTPNSYFTSSHYEGPIKKIQRNRLDKNKFIGQKTKSKEEKEKILVHQTQLVLNEAEAKKQVKLLKIQPSLP